MKRAEEEKQEAALCQNFECDSRSTSQELKTNAERGLPAHGDDVQNRGWRVCLGGAEDCHQGVPRVACRKAGLGKRRSSGKVYVFDDESSDLANMDALTRATVARKVWQKTVSFRAIHMVDMSAEQVSDSDRSAMLSFLSNGDRQQYAPRGGIIGIVEQKNDMWANRKG